MQTSVLKKRLNEQNMIIYAVFIIYISWLIDRVRGPYWENIGEVLRGPYKKGRGPIFSQYGPSKLGQ